MGVLTRQRWCVVSGLLVPFLALASPGVLKLAGVPPSWAVIWLLPWALVDGPLSGAVAGLGLGLFLLFDKLLDVVLPTGLLSFILGGR